MSVCVVCCQVEVFATS